MGAEALGKALPSLVISLVQDAQVYEPSVMLKKYEQMLYESMHQAKQKLVAKLTILDSLHDRSRNIFTNAFFTACV